MALIKCAECNGTVSDKAAACPHCGCPVIVMNTATCNIKGTQYNLSKVMQLVQAGNSPDNRMKGVRIIQSVTNLDVGDAKGLWDEMVRIKAVPKTFQTYNERHSSTNLPKCPTCGSTSLDKITAFDRGVAGGLFGFASKTARSQFRCKKCGYMW